MSNGLRPRRINNGYTSIHKDSGFSAAQFESRPERIPLKAIALSGILSGVGIILLISGFLIATGFADGKHYEKMWPMIILGVIMTVPGIYHMRIAYYAYKGYAGYNYSDIPEFD